MNNTRKEHTAPYRVGRRKKNVVLDGKGLEVVTFSRGKEDMAQNYVSFLNTISHQGGLTTLLLVNALRGGSEVMKSLCRSLADRLPKEFVESLLEGRTDDIAN